jgi:hypothetical protein
MGGLLLRRAEILLRIAETLLRIAEVLLRIAETLLRIAEVLLRIAETLLRIAEVLLRRAEVLLRRAEVLLRRAEVLLRRAEVLLRRTGVLTGRAMNFLRGIRFSQRDGALVSRPTGCQTAHIRWLPGGKMPASDPDSLAADASYAGRRFEELPAVAGLPTPRWVVVMSRSVAAGGEWSGRFAKCNVTASIVNSEISRATTSFRRTAMLTFAPRSTAAT